MTADPVRKLAEEHPGLVRLGRVGWLAKGIVYLLAGALAVLVVARSSWSSSGSGSTSGAAEASPTGAFNEVARTTGGPVILIALALGMFLYAAWRFTTVFLRGSADAEGWATRVGYALSGILYTTFGFTALALARNPTAEADGNTKVSDLSARVMENTAGRWLIGIAGLITIGAGVYRIVLGVKGDVTEDLDLSGLDQDRSRWIERLGSIGEIGRGLAVALIGFFLVRAAVTASAGEATGLDGALRRVAAQPWGVALVLAVGLGLAAYGLFCVLTFSRRRLTAP